MDPFTVSNSERFGLKIQELRNRPLSNNPYWFPIGQVEMLQWSIYHHVMHPMPNDAISEYYAIENDTWFSLGKILTYPSIGSFGHWNIFIGMMFFEQITHFINGIEMFNFPVTFTINLNIWPLSIWDYLSVTSYLIETTTFFLWHVKPSIFNRIVRFHIKFIFSSEYTATKWWISIKPKTVIFQTWQ